MKIYLTLIMNMLCVAHIVSMERVDFYQLVSNGAAQLRAFVAQGEQKYCSTLFVAEIALQQGLQDEHKKLFLSDACNYLDTLYVYRIASKSEYCSLLINGFESAITDHKMQLLFRENPYVVNHYFTCPISGRKVTPLHYVIRKMNDGAQWWHYCQVLLSLGARTDSIDDLGNNVVHYAKSVEVMKLLLRYGDIALNAKNVKGYTPLMRHVCDNNSNMVHYLVGAKARLNTQDRHGNTALHHAVNVAKDVNLVTLLLQSGAKSTIANADGQTPFCSPLGMNIKEKAAARMVISEEK